jgi:hypothetical protein
MKVTGQMFRMNRTTDLVYNIKIAGYKTIPYLGFL